MTNLSDREWRDFSITEVFDLHYGKEVTRAFSQMHIGSIPVISSGKTDNGILCYLSEECKDTRVMIDNCITVAGEQMYYHPCTVFISSLAMGYTIKDKGLAQNKYVHMFLLTAMRAMNTRYKTGYRVTLDRCSKDIIRLPVDNEGNPDYKFMEQYIKERWVDYSWAKQPVNKESTIKLSDAVWKEYRVGDLFNIKNGVAIVNKLKEVRADGMYPIVSASCSNNSVVGHCNDAEYVLNGQCITIGQQTAKCAYQELKFVPTNNTLILSTVGGIDKYTGLFITTVINSVIYGRFNYGRKLSMQRAEELRIKLPSTPEGTPDYKFMEEYIKSLPYSIVLDKVSNDN